MEQKPRQYHNNSVSYTPLMSLLRPRYKWVVPKLWWRRYQMTWNASTNLLKNKRALHSNHWWRLGRDGQSFWRSGQEENMDTLDTIKVAEENGILSATIFQTLSSMMKNAPTGKADSLVKPLDALSTSGSAVNRNPPRCLTWKSSKNILDFRFVVTMP